MSSTNNVGLLPSMPVAPRGILRQHPMYRPVGRRTERKRQLQLKGEPCRCSSAPESDKELKAKILTKTGMWPQTEPGKQGVSFWGKS